ncbi:RNA 2',3'-cyclic phosphodiesterase [Streptomyces sp. NPDC020875]|uniref:RNA 2',3'-cyclic phosphodiesterase n=1 Tax=Streptomyces sp. NPDC020875 TaxID=3154898 RepID=UPI00341026AF
MPSDRPGAGAVVRLFTAVVPPPDRLEELEAAVRRLRELPGSDGLRWTGRDVRHCTLAFYGDIAEGLLPELTERCGRAARRSVPFRIAAGGGGHFGQGVLWAGVLAEPDDLAALRRLAERAGAAARRTGIAMAEHRRYTPHLTLARTRRGIAPNRLAGYAAELAGFAGTPWDVTEYALIRSHPPAGGRDSWYETLATWRLGR